MIAENKHRYVVFDIDGTLADLGHRRHWIATKPKNWAAFNREMRHDGPHHDIIWLLHVLSTATRIFIVSGREGSEANRKATLDWLEEHGIPFEELHMRPAKDYRADDIIKREILEELRANHGDPLMVFDDRDRVVDMWREAGVRCLQVAPGDF